MNLAYKDISHNFGRFVLTTLGVSLLLMLVMGMAGIYRGLVVEATQLVDRIDADLWVVQKDTRGPFAEISRIPRSIEQRALAVPGVAAADGFVSHTIQRERNGKPFRVTIQGLSWPLDKGQWLPLVAGKAFSQSHYQMIADRKLGLSIGETVDLGKDTYTVVGLTDGMVSQSGDPMAFLTLSDSQAVQFDLPGEAIRVERATRVERLGRSDMGRTQPQLQALAGGPASGIAALGTSTVSAVLVDVQPGHDPAAVASIIAAWPDVSVYSHATQRDFLLRGNVDRARRQLGLFRVLLIIVSCIIMALILYTLTLDKLHDIAMLKLMGARNGMILGLIMQQALLMGVLGYGLAFLIGQWTFPYFPRKVILDAADLYQLAAIVLVISVLASLIGIIKALRVEPNEVLA
jgi:putative ABC transport system permease protein